MALLTPLCRLAVDHQAPGAAHSLGRASVPGSAVLLGGWEEGPCLGWPGGRPWAPTSCSQARPGPLEP